MECKAKVCILVLADVNVNAHLKKLVKVLFMKQIVNICLMLPFYILAFHRIMLLTSLWTLKDKSDIESSWYEDDHDLTDLPPIVKANADTDMDSDASDDMNNVLVHYLPRHLLNSTYDSNLLEKGNKLRSVQRTQPPNKK